MLAREEKQLLRSVGWGTVATFGPLAVGMGCWLLAEKVGTGMLASLLWFIGGIAILPLLPGTPFGLLTGSFHADNFMVLAVIADVVFYSFVAHRRLSRKQ